MLADLGCKAESEIRTGWLTVDPAVLQALKGSHIEPEAAHKIDEDCASIGQVQDEEDADVDVLHKFGVVVARHGGKHHGLHTMGDCRPVQNCSS